MAFEKATHAKIQQIVSACERDGDRSIIVLSGVAGTGKTLLALAAAQRFAGHRLLVKQIQFHQSFSYEDFLEGFRPTPTGGFEARPGILLDWNEYALRDVANKYVLLIEEFTRANIAAVLGELMTYVEHRDRLFETPISRRRVRLAKNLTIIATMNPHDRSALEVDDALIRRLRIIECPPSTEQLQEMLKKSLPEGGATPEGKEIVEGLTRLFEECKKAHPDTFAEQMPFGHGAFSGVKSRQDLTLLWHERLKHLLHRPQAPAHPFSKEIEEHYKPWLNL